MLFFFTRLAHPDHQLPLHSGQVVINVVATLRPWLWFWFFQNLIWSWSMVIVLFRRQVAPKWLGPLVLVLVYYRHHISTQGNWNGWGRYRLSIKLSRMFKVMLFLKALSSKFESNFKETLCQVFCELETGHISNSMQNIEKFVIDIWRKLHINKPCLTPGAPRWTLQTPTLYHLVTLLWSTTITHIVSLSTRHRFQSKHLVPPCLARFTGPLASGSFQAS